ncbi:Rh-related protein-like protein, partial [Leptotrombidium deliense]
MITPFFAIIIGIISSTLSLLFQKFVTPLLSKRCCLHDTLSIQATFGIPSLLSAISSAIFAYTASESQYNYSLYRIFPARAPIENSSDIQEIQSYLNDINPGKGRSSNEQALCQLLYLIITIAIASFSGILTGIVVRNSLFDALKYDELFEDSVNFVLPIEEEEYFGNESCCDIESSIETGMNMHNLRLPKQSFSRRRNDGQQQ